ncbi:DUF1109 family protein [Sphingomonas populi]|uniref:DUF1109 family protein n=1 Tax=Sphingomonas populi TaxID=2484750 RepID=A0A4Q6Y4F3_9SPHN|nr:DUF1109 domain-containing protein [Sphingomonas populi]RZF65202.1 DUF1109 family protein [Sphingomonas populi]
MSLKDLIDRLASDTKPVPRRSLFRKILWPSLAIGALCGLVVMLVTIGLNPGLRDSGMLAQIQVRAGLGLASAFAGLAALAPSLRPDVSSVLPKRILATAITLLFAVAAAQLSSNGPSWSVLYLGTSIGHSPWMIIVLASPSFVSLVFGVRFEAPTHLNVTGAALGLTSGGVGAAIYAFGCSDASTPLGLAWFSVGILVATLFGMLIASRQLRW